MGDDHSTDQVSRREDKVQPHNRPDFPYVQGGYPLSNRGVVGLWIVDSDFGLRNHRSCGTIVGRLGWSCGRYTSVPRMRSVSRPWYATAL